MSFLILGISAIMATSALVYYIKETSRYDKKIYDEMILLGVNLRINTVKNPEFKTKMFTQEFEQFLDEVGIEYEMDLETLISEFNKNLDVRGNRKFEEYNKYLSEVYNKYLDLKSQEYKFLEMRNLERRLRNKK